MKKIEQISDPAIVRISDDTCCRYLSNNKSGELISATYYDDVYFEVKIHWHKKGVINI